MQKQVFPGWLPVQVARHYGFPLAELDGAGQSVAIISLGGKLDRAELEREFAGMRVPVPDFALVDTAGIPASQDSDPTVETHLDLEVIGTICAAAKITVYRGAVDRGPGFAAAVEAAVAADNSVISISWGHQETPDDQTGLLDKALVKAREKGITVCVCTGDGSSSAYQIENGWQAMGAKDNLAHVWYPASSPHVLSCGGTQLMMENSVYHEQVWNDSQLKRAATGGGVSEVFAAPQWQTKCGIVIASVNTGHKGRVIPDVSALAAGHTWEMMEDGKPLLAGGTSAVAPLFASLIVLANQKRESLGKPRLGFINDRLYELASAGELFDVITVGHNRPAFDNSDEAVDNYPGYDAGPGFDACSGWGTPNAGKLINALVELA